MIGVDVSIERDDTGDLFERIQSAALASRITIVMARAIAIKLKDHFRALDASRHKYGKHFYSLAGDSISIRGSGGLALVSITQRGLRQRLYGGMIVPKNAKFLTIPASPESYGKRASEFPELKLSKAMNPDGHLQWALVRPASTQLKFRRRLQGDGNIRMTVTPRAMSAGGEVVFWLVRKVNQAPDPTVLPSREELMAAGIGAARIRLNRLQSRSTGGEL